MSILLLTVLVLLVGAVAYRLFDRLVRPVRVLVVCLLMVSLEAFILQSREIFALLVKSSDVLSFPTLSDHRAPNAPNQTDGRGYAYVRFESINQEDQNFLEENLQDKNREDQKPGQRMRAQVPTVDKTGIIGSGDDSALKGELVINSTEAKRPEAITHKETVRRAQLVIHNEAIKRAQPVRSKRQ
jgi:hypothetical protein